MSLPFNGLYLKNIYLAPFPRLSLLQRTWRAILKRENKTGWPSNHNPPSFAAFNCLSLVSLWVVAHFRKLWRRMIPLRHPSYLFLLSLLFAFSTAVLDCLWSWEVLQFQSKINRIDHVYVWQFVCKNVNVSWLIICAFCRNCNIEKILQYCKTCKWRVAVNKTVSDFLRNVDLQLGNCFLTLIFIIRTNQTWQICVGLLLRQFSYTFLQTVYAAFLYFSNSARQKSDVLIFSAVDLSKFDKDCISHLRCNDPKTITRNQRY